MGRWWGDLGVHHRRELWAWNTHRASLRRYRWRWRCGSRLTHWRRTAFLPPNPGRCPHAEVAHAGWAQCGVGPGWSTHSGSTAPSPSSHWLGLGALAPRAALRPDTHPGTSGCACPHALPSSGGQPRSADSSAHRSAQRTTGGPPPQHQALRCRKTHSCHPRRLPGCSVPRLDQGLRPLCRGTGLVPGKSCSGPCLPASPTGKPLVLLVVTPTPETTPVYWSSLQGTSEHLKAIRRIIFLSWARSFLNTILGAMESGDRKQGRFVGMEAGSFLPIPGQGEGAPGWFNSSLMPPPCVTLRSSCELWASVLQNVGILKLKGTSEIIQSSALPSNHPPLKAYPFDKWEPWGSLLSNERCLHTGPSSLPARWKQI